MIMRLRHGKNSYFLLSPLFVITRQLHLLEATPMFVFHVSITKTDARECAYSR